MNSKETPSKPEFKDNLDEIIWSIYQDIERIKIEKVSVESLIQAKLQNSLERYQEELNKRYDYLLERNQWDNAMVMKMMNRFNKDKENNTIYEDRKA